MRRTTFNGIGGFLQNRKGGVAPLLAIGIIPIMAAVGAAVDYGRANSVKAAMQSALDAAALSLARNANTLSAAQLQSSASALFLANFSRPEAQNVQVTASYSQIQGGYNVILGGTATVTTNFMGVLGYSNVPISTNSTVTWGMAKLRVALVLDNTGSMTQTDASGTSKISALKTASHNLLAQLKSAALNDGDVTVSIIPFGKDVNVGASNYNQSWVDWTDWDAANGTCSNTTYKDKSSCTSHGKVWTPKNHNTWNGCITDRSQNYDIQNTTPAAGSTLFPAEQYASCSVQLMPLSYDWTALNSKVDAMVPAGNTNQAIGLAWGWQSLTPSAPLNAPPFDPNYKYDQVIILLTDGLNTQDRWYTSASPIDTRENLACNNIKAANITIYTVLVMSGDSSVLQSCASDPGKYFALTDANSIVTTFKSIGQNLVKLHLTQ